MSQHVVETCYTDEFLMQLANGFLFAHEYNLFVSLQWMLWVQDHDIDLRKFGLQF